jgi:CubicO group peptidase (beta-lactamase class C family)
LILKRPGVLLGALVLTFGGGELRAQNDSSNGRSTASAIDAFARDRMSRLRIPGLAIAVVGPDGTLLLRGFGAADATGRAVTPQTPFIIGSLSKSFTALAIMQLAQRGTLDLDSRVTRYLPWFTLSEPASRNITLRQLLNHTSGIPTSLSQKHVADTDDTEEAIENRVRSYRAEHLDRDVGSSFEYSGANYAVLGAVIEAASGKTYEEYLHENVFGPLEMNNSFTSEGEALAHGLASGHLYWFSIPRETHLPYNRGSLPQGYVISTAEDMSHFLFAQLHGGTYGGRSVVSAASVETMHTGTVETGATQTHYGMGWEIGPIAGVPAIWHSGSIFNYHANIVLLPQIRIGFVVLENIYSGPDEARLNQTAEGITSILVGQTPPALRPNRALEMVYGLLLLIMLIQTSGMARTILRVAMKRKRPGQDTARTLVRVRLLMLPSVVNFSWGVLIVWGIPYLFGMPLFVTAQRVPDLCYVLILSAILAFVWSGMRLPLTVRYLRDSSCVNAASVGA